MYIYKLDHQNNSSSSRAFSTILTVIRLLSDEPSFDDHARDFPSRQQKNHIFYVSSPFKQTGNQKTKNNLIYWIDRNFWAPLKNVH